MIRRPVLLGGLVLLCAAATIGVVSCVAPASVAPADSDGASDHAVLSSSELESTLQQLPKSSVSTPPVLHLAKGLVPPTNRWFSALAFGAAQPVFPMPLSFSLVQGGFTVGLPSVTTSANSIGTSAGPVLTVHTGADGHEVGAYDDVSVGLDLTAAGRPSGRVTLAEGSPVLSYTAARDETIGLSRRFSSPTRDAHGRTAATADIGGRTFLAILPPRALDAAGSQLELAAGASLLIVPVPDHGSAMRVADAISGPLHDVQTGYSMHGSRAVTTLGYHADGGSTVFGTLPAQRAGADSCIRTLGSYPTVYGTMQLCSGNSLSWSVPSLAPDDRLDLTKLSASERSAIVAQLKKDVEHEPTAPSDSYGGGKSLYRLANLLQLARELDQTSLARTVENSLEVSLEQWTSPFGCQGAITEQCFVYDPAVRGIVGLKASYGSDQFNDHHFHYGYFLYAAAVLAEDKPAVLEQIQPVMDLLAADLAQSGGARSGADALFPQRRTFDPYVGHSWASGYAPLPSGNDQESSSEAVDAWNGLALWAKVTGNAPLQTEASWMLANEANAASTLWVNPAKLPGSAYAHPYIGINWSAKRDFSTWFSSDASAVLAIQLIPMSPVSHYLGSSPAQIEADLKDAAPHGSAVLYGDYLLMYQAMAGPAQAKQAAADAAKLPDQLIDGADSRSYLMAYIDSYATG